MKKTKLVVAILICVVPFTLVHAQRSAGSFSIGGHAGAGLPIGPESFSEDFGIGLGFGGELKFNISEKTSIAGSFTIQKMMLDDEKIKNDYMAATDDKIEGGDVTTNIISVNLVQYFTPPDASMGFYLTAGGGYYMMSADDIKITQSGGGSLTISTDKWENNFGINGGAGLEFGGGTLCFFAEGKFHYIFTEVEATMLITAMGGVKINL